MNCFAARRAWMLAASFAVCEVAALPAAAQAAALLDVTAQVAPGHAPRAVLTFLGGVPAYKIYGNATNDVSLLLIGTSRSANLAATVNGHDSLRSITIENVGDNLEVTFHDASPSKLSISTGNGTTLIASLDPGPDADNGGNFGATAPSPPPAFNPGGGPGDAAGDNQMVVVPLSYADLSEVVGLLVAGQQIASNDTFAPQQQSFGSTGLGFGAASIGGISAPISSSAAIGGNVGGTGGGGSMGQQINDYIGIDRRLNAIVLTGPPDVVARLKAKIAKLDVPLPAVVLETQVVELTDTAARDVGIDFSNGGGPAISATYQIHSLTTGQGSVDLQAAVYAQISKGNGKVIARPRVVAQNGGSAQIVTGDALPIVTSIAVSGVSAVSQQVQYVNVGVNLQIEPRISADGNFVTSHIFSEVSSVTGYQQGYPTLSQREATTSATVQNGDAFVIGGLLQQNEIDNLAKVPGLGDLPLIGAFFRVRHSTAQTTNLYIIVVPHVLTTGNPAPAWLLNQLDSKR